MVDAERIAELEKMVKALYHFAIHDLTGMTEAERTKAVIGIDKKLRKVGILPPAR